MSPEHRLLQATGLNPEVLDSGCCGLAGSFGYEAGHHDISVKIGERVLFPAVRKAEPDTIVVSDGFSCRQQIAHGTPRQAMHLAEVLQMALQPAPKKPGKRRLSATKYVEKGHIQPKAGYPALTALTAGAGILSASLYLLNRTRNRLAGNNASKPLAAD